MGISILASAGFALALTDTGPRLAAGAAALLTLTSLLVTRLGNVPINGEIRGWSATNPPADWAGRLQRWESFHDVRTAVAIGAFIVLLLVTESAGRRRGDHGNP
ncbi:anthrone oxygenase family protein [Actinoplanes sp. NPDC023801]|uniref:anthrone oxygenase family protein n=1 Tax=Actinoplanes sp. NPDC023801 TaxID=3154595 RepID=UPI003411D9FB